MRVQVHFWRECGSRFEVYVRYAIFLILLTLCVALFVYSYWVKFDVLNRRFNFRITDIWASMAGLSPTMTAAGYLSNHSQEYSNEMGYWIMALMGVALFQIGGLAVGRMDLEIRKNEVGAITAWSSAVSIVTGAWLGLALSAGVLPIVTHFVG